ncbi:MAG: LuxR C-terminal-related transcriptional regulator, partial [Sphaerochaetaceae bacterium]
AQDYLTKDSSITEVIQSIKDVHNNTLALRPSITKKIQGEFKRLTNEKEHLIETLNIFSKLTTSEFDIILACSKGLKYKQIAKERFVEEVTIRTHVNNILKKFHKKRIKEVIKLMEETDILNIYKP